MAKGIIKRYDFRKGFGFIADDKSGEDLFFHKSAWQGSSPIKKGVAVQFTSKDSEKGPQAESVIPIENGSSVNERVSVQASSPASLDDRITSLEKSLKICTVLSVLSIVSVIVLVVDRLVS